MSLLRALWELGEFAVKAMRYYAQSEEGKAELLDVIQALQGDEDPDADNPEGE